MKVVIIILGFRISSYFQILCNKENQILEVKVKIRAKNYKVRFSYLSRSKVITVNPRE